jgi:Zn-dependent membrane protease YugP
MLDGAGLTHVQIEQTPGAFTDQYDAQGKVLRLGADAFHGRSMTALGIAMHEAGHAVQYEARHMGLVVRDLAIPAAHYGSVCGLLLVLSGFLFPPFVVVGSFVYGVTMLVQFASLPVELSASRRARDAIVDLQIVEEADLHAVQPVLTAAALTELALTLQSVVSLVHVVLRFLGGRERA